MIKRFETSKSAASVPQCIGIESSAIIEDFKLVMFCTSSENDCGTSGKVAPLQNFDKIALKKFDIVML